ncbi:MAG: PA14 domain-containing protein [Sporocytophaga sp.]|nr:PA14 domain-containing protein [Sporocytophaga sp.]
MKKKYSILTLAILLILNSIGSLMGQQATDWQPLGPVKFPLNKIGQINGISRTGDLKFHPTDPKKMYAVSVVGGLFISNDEGKNWISGGTDTIPQAHGTTVCIDYTNEQIMYFGTGDEHFFQPWQRTNGVWKTVNGGKTWFRIGESTIGNRSASEILMSPVDHNVLIASTDDGIWKSLDAGNSWTKKAEGTFPSMVFRMNDNPNIMYATSNSGFFRSVNLGDSWDPIALPGTGLSGGGRIGVTKASPDVVYLTFVGDNNSKPRTCTPVLKSSNSGLSFEIVKPAGGINLNGYTEFEGGQGDYNFCFTVDPLNANTLYAGGHVVFKSTDGGVNWVRTNPWHTSVHTDMHNLIFSPHNDRKLYNTNDGGIWSSDDGGFTWLQLNDGIAGAEASVAAQSPVRKDRLCIGTQDNGELLYTDNFWFTNGGGDFHTRMEFDYNSADYVYRLTGERRYLPNGHTESLNYPFSASGNGEQEKLVFNPSNLNVAFLSRTDIYRSVNITGPPSWTKIKSIGARIMAMASHPSNANLLYAVDENNNFYVSENALDPVPVFQTYPAPAAAWNAASIAPVKGNQNVVYISCGGSVFRSGNKGASWGSLINGTVLPSNVNIIKLIHDDYSTDESIYAASSLGVWYKNNSTVNTWTNYSKGLPAFAKYTNFLIYNDGTSNSELRMVASGRGVFRRSLSGKPAILRDPENPSNFGAGLNYKYYEGTWDHLPNFNSLVPAQTGTTTDFNLAVRQREEYFGVVYTGFVWVPADAVYTFFLNSQDGSKLYIGDQLVIHNDVLNSTTEKSSTIGLKTGRHAIRVEYFNNTGVPSLTISFSSPTLAKQVLPASRLFKLPAEMVCPDGGAISREIWKQVPGSSVADIPVTTIPHLQDQLGNLLENRADMGDEYGVRLRGYICAPYSGEYKFWLSSDEAAQLWLSTDQTPAMKQKIAELTNWTGPRDWYAYTSQQSASISLVAGQKYYIEVLHKENSGNDNLAVGWQLPSGEMERPIAGHRLSPYQGVANTPGIKLILPLDKLYYTAGSSLPLQVELTQATAAISKVEYFVNGVNLGLETGPDFSHIWTNIAAGNYRIYAKVTDASGFSSISTVKDLTFLRWRNPDNPANTAPGITTEYHQGSFGSVFDMNSSTLVRKTTGTEINIDDRDRDDDFGFKYNGFLEITDPGIYFFNLIRSDDGFVLSIGDTILINNDGFSGQSEDKEFPIALRAGKHKISAAYFEGGGEQYMNLGYYGPNTPMQPLPANRLFIETQVNTSPVVSLTSPANGQTYTAPATVQLAANAVASGATISKVEFYNGTVKLGEDPTSPYTYSWSGVSANTYSITARAYNNLGQFTTSDPVSITVNGTTSTCLINESVPAPSLYVVRNLWGDNNNGSSVTADAATGSMKVTHRAYGQSELYVIETGKTISLTSGQVYTISFDFKDYAGAPVTGVDVGFAQGLNSSNNGPQLPQPMVAAPAGYSSSAFTTKSVNLTSSVTASNVNLVFRLSWNGQPVSQVEDFIKNINVCNASGLRIAEANENALIVMPNPTIETFTLRAEKAIEMIYVTDGQGKQIYTNVAIPQGADLEFGKDFEFGIYNLSVIYTDGSREILKILKTK